ncbi:MAG: diaminopimelate epimerase [Rickettsiaceae bacterium]|nr:diaminopimelate epimerase [Rickettsiaceae bacterium]
MQKIPFVKMHGLGNDFVIISEDNAPKSVDMSVFVKEIANRNKGVGCDQFIIYNYDIKTSVAQMEIYNQDGSKALACGNASRCLSRLLFDITGAKDITLKVSDRNFSCEYYSENEIKVDMGAVSFDESWMPSSNELWNLAERYLIEPKEMLCVDVGNPHLVIFSKLPVQDQAVIGKEFQNIGLFKDGVNVSFASVEDNKIHLKVWERGTGFTYACGSGAVASFAAANKLGFANNDASIMFALGGLKMKKDGQNISITGPASYVFFGEYIYD